MERIKQAVERARHDRHTNSGLRSTNIEITAKALLGDTVRLNYSHTRIVPVTPSTLRKNKVVGGIEDEGIVTAYKILSTQVTQRLHEHNWNSVAVVSPNSGEGKTLTAINLAISIAREVDKTVLLVDLDLRTPRVADYFDHEPVYGIADYLYGRTPISEILFNPSIERLVVLPGKDSESNSAELLASVRMEELVEELKVRYPSRIIVFDLPPLLSTADALAFSPFVESALLVIDDGRTLKKDLSYSLNLLKVTNVLGTVLNRQID